MALWRYYIWWNVERGLLYMGAKSKKAFAGDLVLSFFSILQLVWKSQYRLWQTVGIVANRIKLQRVSEPRLHYPQDYRFSNESERPT